MDGTRTTKIKTYYGGALIDRMTSARGPDVADISRTSFQVHYCLRGPLELILPLTGSVITGLNSPEFASKSPNFISSSMHLGSLPGQAQGLILASIIIIVFAPHVRPTCSTVPMPGSDMLVFADMGTIVSMVHLCLQHDRRDQC